MGLFEKRRFKNLLTAIQNYDPENPATHIIKGKDIKTDTMRSIYEAFSLDVSTRDFTGHALGLHRNDVYVLQKVLLFDIGNS